MLIKKTRYCYDNSSLTYSANFGIYEKALVGIVTFKLHTKPPFLFASFNPRSIYHGYRNCKVEMDLAILTKLIQGKRGTNPCGGSFGWELWDKI